MPTGHLHSWQDPEEYFCYWDANDDGSNMYIFSDPPKRWKCGIVHLAEFTLQSYKELKYKDFLQAVGILMRIQRAAGELELDVGKYKPRSFLMDTVHRLTHFLILAISNWSILLSTPHFYIFKLDTFPNWTVKHLSNGVC